MGSPRVLAILYTYPPMLVPASICYAKLILALRQQGVDVEIVTITEESFDSPGPIPLDPSMVEVLPDDVVAHRVRSRERSKLVKLAKRLDRSRRFTYRWLEPKKREWIGPALERLRSLDLSRFDLVLTCSQPHANHLLGLELKRRTGLPWIAYLSDPWTDNPYAHFGTPAVLAHNRAIEDEVYATADRVLFTCREMLDYVLERHPALDAAKTDVLPHMFVPDWYRRGARLPEQQEVRPRVKLLQTGSFYGPRTPVPLVESLTRLPPEHLRPADLRIDSFGGMDQRHVEMVRQRGLAEVFVVEGFIPYLRTLALMPHYDVLLLIDAPVRHDAESIFLPSKLIDYVGAGIPILAVTPERGATARVVREVGGTICAIDRPQELDAVLAELAAGGRLPTARNEEAAHAYRIDRVGSVFASMLRDCTAKSSPAVAAVPAAPRR